MSTPNLTARDALNLRVLSSDQPTDKLAARTMRGGAIAVGSQILRTLLQIAGIAILARLLAPAQFGLVAMASTVTAFVSVLTDLNMSTAAIQREKLDQQSASGMLYFSIGTAFVALAITVLAIPIAVWIYKDERLPLIIIGLAATLPIYSLGSMHQALLTRNMRWLDVHLIAIASPASGLLAAIVSAWLFNAGYWALIVQAWTTAAVYSMVAWARCPWRPGLVRDWSGAKSTLKFGLNLTASMILSYFARQLDKILLGWRWGSTELGYYSRAYALLETPLNFLTGPLGSTMIPAMSQMQSDPQKWRKAYLDGLAVITFVGGAMASLLYGGVGPIIEILLGPGWSETRDIFSGLVLSMLAATPMRTTGWIYVSLGRTNRMFQWALIGVPMYVAAFVIGLPSGAAGVALCYSISQLFAFVPCMWMATRNTSVSMADVFSVVSFPTLATVAIGLGLSAAAERLDPISGVAAIGAAGVLYVILAAAAVWHLPVYGRLRVRAASVLDRLRTVVAPGLQKG